MLIFTVFVVLIIECDQWSLRTQSAYRSFSQENDREWFIALLNLTLCGWAKLHLPHFINVWAHLLPFEGEERIINLY